MRKYLGIILAVLMLLGTARLILAEPTYTRGPNWNTKILVDTGSSGIRELETSITVDNLIYGISYTDSAAGNGAIYDYTTASGEDSVLAAYLIAEVKVAAGGAGTLIFPFPYKVTRGLVTAESTNTGVLMVYYE